MARSRTQISVTESFVGYQVFRTAPSKVLRHDISDEELGALADMRRDYLWEGAWVALGLAAGAAPNAIAALLRCYASQPPIPLEIVDLVQIIFMFVGLIVWAVLFFVLGDKSKKAADLAAAIRERTEHIVQG